jgi:hypothetical protein
LKTVVLKQPIDGFMKRKFILLSLLIFCVPQTAFAYIDPGTGAYLVQALAALAGSVIFYVNHPRELLRRLKEKLFKRNR